jgi:hypothetical protein
LAISKFMPLKKAFKNITLLSTSFTNLTGNIPGANQPAEQTSNLTTRSHFAIKGAHRIR